MGRFAFSNFQPAPITCDLGITQRGVGAGGPVLQGGEG